VTDAALVRGAACYLCMQRDSTETTRMHDHALRLGTPLQLWYELEREGEDRAGTALPDPEEHYRVFELQRHQGDVPLGARTAALEYLHALDHGGHGRADALRDVGDRCLLIAGLFPRVARRRNVQPGYYAALGRAAYGEVASATRAGHAELFALLASRFDAMLRVLAGLQPRAGLETTLRALEDAAERIPASALRH